MVVPNFIMKATFLFISVLSFLLIACSENQAPQQTPKPVKTIDSELQVQKQIIVSFYPLAFITEQIVGDKAQVTNMAGSVDVHTYEPSPQDLVKLNKADLVVFQGAQLEPWTESVIPALKAKNMSTLEVTHDIELMKMEEHDEHENSEENGDKHVASEGEEHDEHHHGEFDPHIWLDPVFAQKMTNEILDAVVKVDVANKDIYEANAKALNDRLAQLDKAYQSGLTKCKNEKMIISHDAYGYLAHRYGFEFHSIAGLSPKDEASAKILAELKQKAQEGISHILVEENAVRRFADTLARETGLGTLPVNPLGRGTLDSRKDYFDIMQENLSSFKTALNCQ